MTWIDLTDMAVWKGHYTGIQRVTHMYAERYAREGANFLLYDKIDGRFVQVPFDLLQVVNAIENEKPLTRRQKLKYSVGKPYYMLPPQVKVFLRPGVKAFNHITRHIASQLFDGDKRLSPFHAYPTAIFSAGDVVLLIGASWNEKLPVDQLKELQEEKKIKIVQHINDILPIYQPHLFADELPRLFTPYIDQILRVADLITVISQATKNDIMAYGSEHGITLPPVHVVRLGEDISATKPVRPKELKLDSVFLLAVGTFEIRKNYLLLYQAAKLAQLKNLPFPQIVIVGRKGWLTEDLSHVIEKDPFTKNKIIWLKGLEDKHLAWLYQHCAFTVFPSLCEGWGLPIAESLQQGKLCLASGVSSMLEIGEGFVDYFLPFDARSCMEQILSYAENGKYKQHNEKIRQKYTVYTWDDSYKGFKAAVDSIR